MEYMGTIYLVVTTTVSIIAVLMDARWTRVKKKLRDLRKFIDVVDDALNDDKISEEEFREIFQRLVDMKNA